MTSAFESSIVRICTAEGTIAGAGFLVGARQILTCAHVVAGVLGLPDDTPEKPQALVCLDFPRIAPRHLLSARVSLWRPPQPDGGDDIAGLELESDPPPGAQVAQLAQVDDLWGHSFRAFGFPKGEETGVWATGRLLGQQVTNWVQIEDVKETGFSVEPGFSGTPVWDTQLEAVVGMVVAAERRTATKTAFAIPVDILVSTWSLIESLIQPFVFLCYARADIELVMRLRTDLHMQGMNIWIDRAGLEPGTPDWEDSLRRAIRAARAVLLIASPNARSSRYVKDELRLAEMYQRPVYPVWIAGSQWMDAVPLGWGGTQYIDARKTDYETAVRDIAITLNKASFTPPKAADLDFEPRNPYKGLRAFTQEDATDFFGRNQFVHGMVEAAKAILPSEQNARLLIVIGPSGSGKSSIVMAGLLSKLRQGTLPGSKEWVYLEPMVPGQKPIEALTLTLSSYFPNRSLKTIREDLEDESGRGLHLLATTLAKRQGMKVVLFVDQFEELFTQTISEEERQQFIDVLVTAITEPGGPTIMLSTMRADFYDRPAQYPDLARLIQERHQLVLPMNIKDLRAVIEMPAALPDVQLTFEGDLIGDLLFEVQGQVGALPLLQFTLDQLYQKRSEHLLTLSAYREMGGVKGALTRQAESTYTALPSEEHRRLSRALFVRLIDPGVSEQDTTRRRAALSEFSLDDPIQTRLLRETIDAFITARLLTTNEIAKSTTVEVSHEALIREWSRLSEWLREAREDIKLQQIISEDAVDWVRRGRPVDRVYRGTELTEAEAWTERNVPSTDEVAFLRASAAERQHQEDEELNQRVRELNLQRRVVSRQRLLVTALSVFSAIVIVLASLAQLIFLQAEAQRKNAEMEKQIALVQANNAQSRALAAGADVYLAQKQLDQALLLSVKASQIADTYEARDSLLSTLMYSPHILTMLHLRLPYSPYPVNSLAFSPTGDLLFSADDNDVFVWNTKTKKSDILSQVGSRHPNYISQIAVSRNDQLATLGPDGVWLWNAKTGKQLAQLEGNDTQTRPSGWIGGLSLGFSPDGRRLAVGQCQRFLSTGNSVAPCGEAQIFLWDTVSKQRIGSPFNIPNAEINSVAFSPDGKILASGNNDGTVHLWNVAAGSPIGSPLTASAQPVSSVAFSPDGKTLASGNGDGSVRLWNVAAGTLLHSFVSENIKNISSIAFNPDGKTLASGSEDGTVRLWNVAAGSLIGSPLTASAQPVSTVAFSPDGKTLVSGNDRDTIGVWDMGADTIISQRLEYMRKFHSAVFSRDGKTLITGSEDGKVVLWDIVQGKPTAILDTAVYPIIKPDQKGYGSLLSIQSLAISGDGRTIAAGRLDGMITLWDMKTKLPLAHFSHPNPLGKIAFSLDGRILASLSQSFSSETKVILWDVTTGTIIRSLPIPYHDGYYATPSFSLSPDGKLLAIGTCGQWDTQHQQCRQGQILLWDITKGKLTNMPLPGLTSQVLDVAFSPDGRTLAASGLESILLLDMTTKKTIGQPLSFSLLVDTTSNVVSYYDHITFSPNGRFLMSYGSAGYSSSDDVFILWDQIKHEPFARAFPADSSLDDLIFYPNEQKLASVGSLTSGKSGITLWDISVASWQAHACSIANRNFIMSEWKQFFTDQSYSKVCPNLPVDSSVPQALLAQAHFAVLTGDTQAASSAYVQATQLAMEDDDPSMGSSVCKSGSLDQFAKQVLPACEYAVKSDPNNVNYRDSRALARALAGDTKGAITDYRFVVEPSNGYGGLTSDQIKERTSWLRALEAGHNPFDAKTLKILQNE